MDIKHIATLANLPLTNDQLHQLQSSLPQVLDLVDHIQQLDTSGIEPTSQVTGLINITRPDEIDSSRLLPPPPGGYFKTKAIF